MGVRYKHVKALVVDDNEINRMVLETMLKAYSIECILADSGEDSVAVCGVDRFDIIFMDYIMPGMNGIEATWRIRDVESALPENQERLAWRKNVPIIALSARVTDEERAEFLAVGARCILTKPVEMSEIRTLLREVFGEGEVNSDNEDEKNPAVDRFIDALSEIGNLNVTEGLRHSLDSVKNYYKVLKASVRNVYSYERTLREYTKENSGMELDPAQNKELRVCVHSLKGILSNIGFNEMSDYAAVLENRIADNNLRFGDGQLRSFGRSLIDNAAKLESILETHDFMSDAKSISSDIIPISKSERKLIVSELEDARKKYEIDRILTNLKKLAGAEPDEFLRDDIKKAIDEVEVFNYRAVDRILLKIDRGETR